jgi:hypothetical protein
VRGLNRVVYDITEASRHHRVGGFSAKNTENRATTQRRQRVRTDRRSPRGGMRSRHGPPAMIPRVSPEPRQPKRGRRHGSRNDAALGARLKKCNTSVLRSRTWIAPSSLTEVLSGAEIMRDSDFQATHHNTC